MNAPTDILKILSTLAVVFPLFAISNAQAAATCDGYANAAVFQQSINVDRRCAFAGPRWHSDRNGHKLYCELVGPAIAAIGTQERTQMLEQCAPAANNNNQNALPQLSGEYTIRQKSNGNELDAYQGQNDNNVVTRNLQNNATQTWIFTSLGNDVYTIQQKSSRMYLDAHQDRNDNSVVTRNNQNNNTQRWIVLSQGNNVYTLQQKSNGRYMDAYQGENDNSVVTRNAQNNDTQRWVIR